MYLLNFCGSRSMKVLAIRRVVLPICCLAGTATLDVVENLVENHTRRTKRDLDFSTEENVPMIDDSKNPDIEDVIKEEKSRGKRRVDTKALRQRQILLRKFREALKLRTEREFVEAIRELGLADDPEKLREALKIWRSSF